MQTPKQILKALAKIAPEIAITIHWTHDQDSQWKDIKQCFDANESPDNWQAWNSEVRATAVVNGKLKEASAYMGGTWEKAGDDPRISNPDISGYLPQMIEEALSDDEIVSPSLAIQLHKAQEFIKREMETRYNEQNGTKHAA